jgi:NADH dehydrogenase subunit N (EC 1.6.5.3)
MFYMFAYLFMTLGAFGIILILRRKGIEAEEISDFVGLNKKNPMAAFLMLIFMFSLAGIPPFGGFLAKFYVFMAAVHAGYTWLAVVGVLLSAVGAYYYIRVVMAMYMKDPVEPVEFMPNRMEGMALFVTAGMTVLLGVFPLPFVHYIETSLAILVP